MMTFIYHYSFKSDSLSFTKLAYPKKKAYNPNDCKPFQLKLTYKKTSYSIGNTRVDVTASST